MVAIVIHFLTSKYMSK